LYATNSIRISAVRHTLYQDFRCTPQSSIGRIWAGYGCQLCFDCRSASDQFQTFIARLLWFQLYATNSTRISVVRHKFC